MRALCPVPSVPRALCPGPCTQGAKFHSNLRAEPRWRAGGGSYAEVRLYVVNPRDGTHIPYFCSLSDEQILPWNACGTSWGRLCLVVFFDDACARWPRLGTLTLRVASQTPWRGRYPWYGSRVMCTASFGRSRRSSFLGHKIQHQ